MTYRPRILISTATSNRTLGLRRLDSVTGHNYSDAIAQAGGLPVMVANLDPELASDYLELADGLLLSGGGDLDPELWGAPPHPQLGEVDPQRDAFELELYRQAKATRVPVLGICRGLQVINVAEGGTLHQHLPELEETIQHEQADTGGTPLHTVALESNSLLSSLQGTTRVKVNSYHHQAVHELGRDLRVVARSADGVVEAVEGSGEMFVMGLQWHPEMSFRAYPDDFRPFQIFLNAARARRAELHHSVTN